MNRLSTDPGGSSELEEFELDGGGRRVGLRGRRAAADARPQDAAPATKKEPARIITMAWGERYIDDLLSMTLPALLAPGNLPSFTEYFDSELVVVTELRFFDRIIAAPVVARLLQHCDLRLLPIDDLLSSWYGVTLTYALVRGFADLGPAMTDTHLVFLNADFIVADGSYRKLAEVIRRGERLVVSPSYCGVLEEVVRPLRARLDPHTGSLPIARRDMAALLLAHRHNCMRAKTVNQPLFNIGLFDQFYWYVDEQTLLGRQLPIAVVYMRPERVLTELRTFWDYGVVAEYCPTIKPCVLGDSDDFLMAELRTATTFRERHRLSWPSVDAIARHLSSYVTQDHLDYGRHDLVLHARDLPEGIDMARREFKSFVDAVYSRIAQPLSHRDHPFWTMAFPGFSASRLQATAALRASLGKQQRIRSAMREDPVFGARRLRIAAARARREGLKLELLTTIAAQAEEAVPRTGSGAPSPAETRLRHLEAQIAEGERELAGLEAAEAEDLGERPDAAAPGREPAAEEPPQVAQPQPSRLLRLYYALFGKMPAVTKWHPFYTVVRHVNAELAAAQAASSVLLVSSGGLFGSLFLRECTGRKVTLTVPMALSGDYDHLLDEVGRFDLWLCDLEFEDMLLLRDMLAKLRPRLREGAKLILFYENRAAYDLDGSAYRLSKGAFPSIGEATIRFAGSRLGAIAVRAFSAVLAKTPVRPVATALALTTAAPIARLAAWFEERRDPSAYPRRCTSMTVTVTLR